MSRKILVILSLTVLLLPFSAFADGTATGTNWALLPSTGTYTWDGNTSDGLVGSNIGVASVIGAGTGESFSILYGTMNFTSGAYDGNGSDWSWGDGGSLSITGCVVGISDASCSQSNPDTLLSDDFTGVQIVPVLNLGQYSFDVVFGSLTGTIDTAIASYFGIDDGFAANSLNVIFTSSTPGKALNGTNLGGAIQALPVAASEDASLLGGLALYAIAAAVLGLAWRLGFRKAAVR